MRKTSAYARKMRRRAAGEVYNGTEWLNTIQRCAQYSNEAPIGSWLTGTQAAADNMRHTVRHALDRLLAGQVQPGDTDVFDTLAHAVGVALVRTHETGGDRSAALEVLGLAKIALTAVKDRWQRIHKWGATRVEQEALADAVELYETILMSSSPAQMSAAAEARMRILKAQGWVEPDHTAVNVHQETTP